MTIHQMLLGVGSGSGGGDPYFANVKSLVHFDGTNGSTTITDQIAGHTWSANAVTLSTAQKQFGTASVYVPGSGSVSAAQSTDFDLGTGDFTLELSVYANSVGINNIVIIEGSGASTSPTIYCLANGTLIYYTGADRITSSSGVITATTWIPVAYSRVSGTGYLFAAGVLLGSWSDSTDYTRSGGNRILVPANAAQLDGYFDELRLTVGVGRYTASYTPAASAFPNS